MATARGCDSYREDLPLLLRLRAANDYPGVPGTPFATPRLRKVQEAVARTVIGDSLPFCQEEPWDVAHRRTSRCNGRASYSIPLKWPARTANLNARCERPPLNGMALSAANLQADALMEA
jgi:hypothetical protein